MKYQNTKSRSEFNFNSSGLAIALSRSVSSIKNTIVTTPSGLALLHISSITPSKALNAWYITGFTDPESCFFIQILKNIKYKTGEESMLRLKCVYIKEIDNHWRKFKRIFQA